MFCKTYLFFCMALWIFGVEKLEPWSPSIQELIRILDWTQRWSPKLGTTHPVTSSNQQLLRSFLVLASRQTHSSRVQQLDVNSRFLFFKLSHFSKTIIQLFSITESHGIAEFPWKTYFSSEKYGCFLKWLYPQNTPKWWFLVGKPIVVGETHHFRKPPLSGGIKKRLQLSPRKNLSRPSTTTVSIEFEPREVRLKRADGKGRDLGWKHEMFSGEFLYNWVVVSNTFYFHPEPWGNDPIWLIFFKLGWNHHLDNIWVFPKMVGSPPKHPF